ncbi:MAG: glycosyltransferase family 39 protein [Planctomycetota bacterium]|nr:glycosyltransferase family 39 protein [Planctomycetota bacterium]
MEPGRQRWVLVGLIAVAMLVFGIGINWGLPSRAGDVFFSPESQSADPSATFRLSGAGIEHEAGGWDDDPDRGADVAAHSVGDRSKPITLLENQIGSTPQLLAKQGDKRMIALLAAQNRAQRNLDAANSKASDSNAISAAQDEVSRISSEVERHLVAYNDSNIPRYTADARSDAVNRARILRRYRLYSYQPDEMITFRALALMHPDKLQFDPRLYQYGGLWIYPVAGLLKAASLLGFVQLSGDRAIYLDHPQEFGRLYVIARAYSAAWGLIGVIAVFQIARRVAGGHLLPATAGLCFIFMPVVIDLAHEAKPHLPGAVLLMLSVLSASKFVETRKIKRMFLTGALCGAAAGMVLWAVAGLVLIPLAALAGKRRLVVQAMGQSLVGLLSAVLVYAVTNPYVILHLFSQEGRLLLASNLGNSKAMYNPTMPLEGLATGLRLLAVGMSWPLTLLGTAGLIILLTNNRRPSPASSAIDAPAGVEPAVSANRSATGWLLGTLAFILLVQFVIFAAGKQGEYARFAIVTDIALMVAAVCAVGSLFASQAFRIIAACILIGATGVYGLGYERGFLKDTRDDNSRTEAAQELSVLGRAFPEDARPTLGVAAEPAPYCMPPFDLTRWKLVLMPRSGASGLDQSMPDVVVQPSERINVFDPGSTPMSWANKRIDLYFRNNATAATQ